MPKRPAAFIAQLALPLLLLIALAVPGVPQDQDPATPTQRPRKVFPKEQEPEDVLRFDTCARKTSRSTPTTSSSKSPSFKSKNEKVKRARSPSFSPWMFRAA